MADLGHRVIGYDLDPAKIDALRRAEAPFFEPGLEDLLTRTHGENLVFTGDVVELKNADIVLPRGPLAGDRTRHPAARRHYRRLRLDEPGRAAAGPVQRGHPDDLPRQQRGRTVHGRPALPLPPHPPPLATLGLIGYPALLAGCVLDLFNLADITQGVGLVALVPGGVFELVLPIWLLAKGFTYPREAHDVRHHR